MNMSARFSAGVQVYHQFGGSTSWVEEASSRANLIKRFREIKKKYPKAEVVTFGPIKTTLACEEPKGMIWKRVKRPRNEFVRDIANWSKWYDVL